MVKEIRLPKFGDTMEEGTIVDCKVRLGDHVKSGDVLFDVETDKATIEIESPADGFVKRITVEVGQTYRVGMLLLILGGKDEQLSEDFLRSLLASSPAPIAEPKPQPTKPDKSKESSAPPVPAPTIPREIKLGHRITVTRFHRLTAQKMLRSKHEIPCFYLTVRADVTELVSYRMKLNEAGPVKVTYNDFIIKAVAMGLERFPIMTGQIEGESIKLAGSIGVGLAISVPDGLVAPIIKEPDKKTITEIASCSQQLADKAKNGQLMPDDLEGGCITVSNLGAFGIDSFIPIVIPGQCSILGVGKITDVCLPQDGDIAVRKVMNMTLSVDHRITNGTYASQFLDFVKKVLEDPACFK
jgi:pyruvate dehydrogenase E2 component (dihydrolipoamide acetyltransferase)